MPSLWILWRKMGNKRANKNLLYGDSLLTAKEVTELLNISRSTMYLLIASGELHVIRITSRALRFRPEDVRLYLSTLVCQDPDTWGTLEPLLHGLTTAAGQS